MSTGKNGEVSAQKPGLGKRHVIIALLFIAYVSAGSSRSHIAVTIVAMTSEDSSNPNFPTFNWTETEKNVPVSSFYAGLMISSIAAGEIIRFSGASGVLYGSFMAHAALTAVTAFVSLNGSWPFLAILRALTGFAYGFLDPLLFLISSRWFPPNERNFFLNVVFVGATIGLALGSEISGLLAEGPTGWPSVFYFSAVPLILFCILWKLFGAMSPEECKSIRPEERKYIEQCLPNVEEKKTRGKTPWKSILTSPAVFAAILADFGHGVLITTLTSQITLFIDDVQDISVLLNGLLSSIPPLTSLVYLALIGFGADLCLTKNILSTLQIRKISATIALAVNATAIVCYGFIGNSLTAIIVLLCFNYFALSFSYVGYLTNPLDISPNHSQLIVGICRAVENVSSFFTPLVFSALLTDSQGLESWRVAFAVAAAPLYFSYIFFVVFGRAEPLPWDCKEIDSDERDTTNEISK